MTSAPSLCTFTENRLVTAPGRMLGLPVLCPCSLVFCSWSLSWFSFHALLRVGESKPVPPPPGRGDLFNSSARFYPFTL